MLHGISQQNRFPFFKSWCKRLRKNEPEGASRTNWGVKGRLLPKDVSIQMSKGGGNCTSIWWLKQWFSPHKPGSVYIYCWPPDPPRPRPHPSPHPPPSSVPLWTCSAGAPLFYSHPSEITVVMLNNNEMPDALLMRPGSWCPGGGQRRAADKSLRLISSTERKKVWESNGKEGGR